MRSKGAVMQEAESGDRAADPAQPAGVSGNAQGSSGRRHGKPPQGLHTTTDNCSAVFFDLF